MHLLHVVGARPNFMKAAPVWRALSIRSGVKQTLVHTGQHYDNNMSDIFFSQLAMPTPDVNLEVGSGSHAQQTAEVMRRFEPIVQERKPDMVVVVGDVNSTMAAALVGAKLRIPIAHVEAGLRSFDRTMPEEINRIVTDRVSDLLLTPSPDGNENLRNEGIPADRVHLVGNIMIDTLLRHLPIATFDRVRDRVRVDQKHYAVLTLHRPSNVDDAETFRGILSAVDAVAADMPVVFPVHPRTRNRISELGLDEAVRPLILVDPMGYIDFL